MGLAFQYVGASGQMYDFLLADMANLKALSWQGGVFCFARYQPEPLYFGEGRHLVEAATAARSILGDGLHGVVTIHFLLENEDRKRLAVVADLVEKYRPPLNRQR